MPDEVHALNWFKYVLLARRKKEVERSYCRRYYYFFAKNIYLYPTPIASSTF